MGVFRDTGLILFASELRLQYARYYRQAMRLIHQNRLASLETRFFHLETVSYGKHQTPNKPTPDFPFYAPARGYWAKKIAMAQD